MMSFLSTSINRVADWEKLRVKSHQFANENFSTKVIFEKGILPGKRRQGKKPSSDAFTVWSGKVLQRIKNVKRILLPSSVWLLLVSGFVKEMS